MYERNGYEAARCGWLPEQCGPLRGHWREGCLRQEYFRHPFVWKPKGPSLYSCLGQGCAQTSQNVIGLDVNRKHVCWCRDQGYEAWPYAADPDSCQVEREVSAGLCEAVLSSSEACCGEWWWDFGWSQDEPWRCHLQLSAPAWGAAWMALKAECGVHVAKNARSYRTPEPRFNAKKFPLRSSYARFDRSSGHSEWRQLEHMVEFGRLDQKKALIGEIASTLVTFFYPQLDQQRKESTEDAVIDQGCDACVWFGMAWNMCYARFALGSMHTGLKPYALRFPSRKTLLLHVPAAFATSIIYIYIIYSCEYIQYARKHD